ncbi:MAG: PnuC protein [Phycisphaerales bacterium JB047]
MSTDLLFKYYGLDWAAMAFTFLSLYRLGSGKRDGFIYGLLANVCWAAFGIMAESIANPLANAVFLAMNLRGYGRWRNSHVQSNHNDKDA